MGIILDTPKTEKEVYTFQKGEFKGAVVSMQGWRCSMEDAFLAIPSIDFDKNTGFFAVFDGHGGDETSSYCQAHFMEHLSRSIVEYGIESEPTTEQYSKLLADSFISFDKEIRDANIMRSGSTAITGFITPTHFIISNLGDSRCVLCSGGKAIPLSFDQKPDHNIEKQRVINAGGIVFNGRINGDLAVARAFGDFVYKQNESLPPQAQEVSCEPEIIVRERMSSDNYILFACDGIWDVFPDPADLVSVLDHLLMSYPTTEEALQSLLDICLERGSKDNMTALLVLFPNAPKPTEEMVSKQRELDEKKRLEQEAASQNRNM